MLRDYDLLSSDYQHFRTLAEFTRATGHEAHGILVDYDIFQNVRPPAPAQPHKIYESGDLDFRLKSNSKAVDAGCKLPNLNDDFTGQAPDLGALEVGRQTPIYGPRR